MRRILIVLFALTAGIVTLALLDTARPEPALVDTSPAQESDTVQVLVYAQDLPRGTLIDAASLKWQEQLRSAVSLEAMTSETADAEFSHEVLNKLVRRDILQGEWIRQSDLLDEASSFMALTLAPGTRAVGLAVTTQKLAGGFILPEDKIDIIHTVTGDFDNDGRQGSISQTILENVRVLAVGDTPTSRVAFRTVEEQAVASQSDVNLKGDTITLQLTDDEAEVLFTALASGQVSLALRAIDDHGPSRIVSLVGFEGTAPAPKPEPQSLLPEPPTEPLVALATEVTAPPPKKLVRLISGGTTSFIDIPEPSSRGELVTR